MHTQRGDSNGRAQHGSFPVSIKGRAARQQLHAEAQAATKVQASIRGNSARKAVSGRDLHGAPSGGGSERRAMIQLVPGADGSVRAVGTEEGEEEKVAAAEEA